MPRDNIRWTDVRNTWPIMTGLVVIGGFLWGMKTDIKVINVQIENLTKNIGDKGVERDGRLNILEEKVRALEISQAR